MRKAFDNIDTNKNGKLDENEIKSFLERTHNDMPMEKIHDMIEKHDASGDKRLNFDEFCNAADDIMPPIMDAFKAAIEDL